MPIYLGPTILGAAAGMMISDREQRASLENYSASKAT
jgi:hypothetical protein